MVNIHRKSKIRSSKISSKYHSKDVEVLWVLYHSMACPDQCCT